MRTVLIKLGELLLLFFDQLNLIAFRAVQVSDFNSGTGHRRSFAQRITLRRGLLREGFESVDLERDDFFFFFSISSNS